MAWQAAAGLGLQALGIGLDAHSASKNIRYQKQFAKKGIQWRVNDAKAAGLHPLYALGAQVPAFSPVMDATGSGLQSMGQDISRAVKATLTPADQKLLDLQIATAQAGLDRTYAETALLQSERLKNISQQFKWLPEENTTERGGATRANTVFGGQAIDLNRQKVPTQHVTPVAPDMPSGSGVPGIVAGVPDGWREFTMPGGSTIFLPTASGDMSQGLEAASESATLMKMIDNINREHNPRYRPGQILASRELKHPLYKEFARRLSALPAVGNLLYRKARFHARRQW